MRKPEDMPEQGKDADALTSARRLRVVKAANEGERAQPFSEDSGDYNIKLLAPLFAYIRNKLDTDTLADIVHDCGLPPAVLERQTGWISHERFEHFLAAAREIIGSDEEFMRACAYDFKKQYGPFALIMRSMSLPGLYQLSARTMHMVCSVGRFEVSQSSRTSVRLLYYTERHESRLVCLSRQAAIKETPTMFLGMPPAKLVEHSCVAHGDACCDYELSWYEPLRMRLIAAGAATGSLVAWALPAGIAEPTLSISLLALVGAMTGGLLEMRRLLHLQRGFADETTMEMEKVIVAHAQATDDLNALRERERDWNRQIEERVATRTRKLNEVIERLQTVLRHRSGAHPVATKDAETLTQRPHGNRLASMETAVDSVSRLVGELVNIASDDATKREMKPEPVNVDSVVAQVRRQLKALMTGRNIRVTVFQTREAPATIHTVRPVLDRVLDNLLFNASRHTDHGTVVVEASGTPGSLLVKVSDTGSGLSKERLEEVFGTTKDSGQLPTHDRSSLAYAARLLDQIGGRLEIMSEPGVGTTVWMYLPVNALEEEAAASNDKGKAAGDDEVAAEQSVVGRVVRIRSKLHPAAPAAKDPS
jgi:signal transduction histidine kinase